MLVKQFKDNPTQLNNHPLDNLCPDCNEPLIFAKVSDKINISNSKKRLINSDDLFHFCQKCKTEQYCGASDLNDVINKSIIKMMFLAVDKCFCCENEFVKFDDSDDRSNYLKKCEKCESIIYKLDGKLSFNVPLKRPVEDNIHGEYSLTNKIWNVSSSAIGFSSEISNLYSFKSFKEKINKLYILK